MVRKMRRAWQRKAAAMAMAAFTVACAGNVYAAPVAPNEVPTVDKVLVGADNTTITPPPAQGQQIETITNTKDAKVAIDWKTFNIGSNASVEFVQAGPNAVAMNRVLQNSASEIYGSLKANGQVFLINPNGVLFGAGSQVNVGGLVASTMNFKDEDAFKKFANLSKYEFDNQSENGAIINAGEINAQGGLVALLANKVENVTVDPNNGAVGKGSITNQGGKIVLAANEKVTINYDQENKINLEVDKKQLTSNRSGVHVLNAGTISADGGYIIMTARDASKVLNTVVNNSGTIEAKSLKNVNGEIVLDGGTNGVVEMGGTINAAGAADKGTDPGGKVTASGQYLTVRGNVDASGELNTTGTDKIFVSDKAGVNQNVNNGTAVWNIKSNNTIKVAETGDTLADANPSTSAMEAAEKALAVATKNLDTTKYDGLKKTINDSQTTVNTLQTAINKANATINSTTASDDEISTARTALTEATSKKTAADKALSDANDAYNAYTEGTTYDQAVNALSAAQKAYNAAWQNAGSVVSGKVLSSALQGTNVSITAEPTDSATKGVAKNAADILVNEQITKMYGGKSAATNLNLTAGRNIVIAQDINQSHGDKTGALNITMNAGTTDSVDSSTAHMQNNKYGANIIRANIFTWGGNLTLNGGTYMGLGSDESGTDGTEREVYSAGGDITINGDLLMAVGNGTVSLHTTESAMPNDIQNQGSITITGNINSANNYTYVSSPGIKWDDAKKAAEKDNRGAIGDAGNSYLATITSGVEDSVVSSVIPELTDAKTSRNGNITGYEAFVGGRTDSQSGQKRTWSWVTGPEGAANGGNGTVFYEQTAKGAGNNVNGSYVNWRNGEPNNDAAGNGQQSTLGVNFNTYGTGAREHATRPSQWDDVQTSGRADGYVKETNLAPSSLYLRAGKNVTIGGSVGNAANGGAVDVVTIEARENIVTKDITAQGFIDIGAGYDEGADDFVAKQENGKALQAAVTTGTLKANNDISVIAIDDARVDGDITAGNDNVYVRSINKTATVTGTTTAQTTVEIYGGYDANTGAVTSKTKDVYVEAGHDAAVKGAIQAVSLTKVIAGHDILVNDINAGGKILVSSTGGKNAVDGGTVTLKGKLISTLKGSSEAVIVGTEGVFKNQAGSQAIQATGEGSSWQVYSYAPDTDTFGDLNSVNHAIWNHTYTSTKAIDTTGGNHYIFEVQPTATITTASMHKTYGDTASHSVSITPAYNGIDLVATYKGKAFDESGVITASASSRGDAAAATRLGGDAADTSDTKAPNNKAVYDISITGIANNTGYSIPTGNVQKAATLTIDRKELIFQNNDISAVYGTAYDEFSKSYYSTTKNWVNGDENNAELRYWTTAYGSGARNGLTNNVNDQTKKHYMSGTRIGNKEIAINYTESNWDGKTDITPKAINLNLTVSGTQGGTLTITDNGSYANGLVNRDTINDVPAGTYSYSDGAFHVDIGGTPIAAGTEGTVVGNYKFTYSGVTDITPAAEKPKFDYLGTANLSGNGNYAVQNGTRGVPGVERVAGLTSAELPFFKVADKQVYAYGTYDVTESPSEVKLTPSAKHIPEPEAKNNQYRSLTKTIDLTNGSGSFTVSYDGSRLNIYPDDANAKQLLKAGDATKNEEVSSKALFTSFNQMGLVLEDLDAIYVHTDATEAETQK